MAQDAHTHLRAMNSLLNRYPTLYADHALQGKDREDFEREWHDHFLFFNKLKGMKSDTQDQEATRSGTIPAARWRRERPSTNRQRFSPLYHPLADDRGGRPRLSSATVGPLE